MTNKKNEATRVKVSEFSVILCASIKVFTLEERFCFKKPLIKFFRRDLT